MYNLHLVFPRKLSWILRVCSGLRWQHIITLKSLSAEAVFMSRQISFTQLGLKSLRERSITSIWEPSNASIRALQPSFIIPLSGNKSYFILINFNAEDSAQAYLSPMYYYLKSMTDVLACKTYSMHCSVGI